MARLFGVITTVQSPTASVEKLFARLSTASASLVVAGDGKGPRDFRLGGENPGTARDRRERIHFLDLQAQLAGPFDLARRLPVGHYCRKNIGYLHAIAQGADCIYETDDDNAPLPSWAPRSEFLVSPRIVAGGTDGGKLKNRWVNVYGYFTKEHIWPRGLPLEEVRAAAPAVGRSESAATAVHAPIQQGLVNNSPDVDAIWRLVLDRRFDFDVGESVFLAPGNWSPFNTQSTWWWPVAYPLLYIPSHCSFRICDIWKSFVAQRCLWEIGAGVAFHPPEVVQERNVHDLMSDFRDEIPGYVRNREIAALLGGLDLKEGEEGVATNLRTCYKAMIREKFFPDDELGLLEVWLADVGKLRAEPRRECSA